MTPKFLAQFSNIDIENTLIDGHISSNIDAYGNLNLISNSSAISASLTSVVLEKQIYDINYIKNYYTTEFTEFTSIVPQVNIESSSIQIINLKSSLQSTQDKLDQANIQLSSLLAKSTVIGGLQAEYTASMALAIDLRIKLGEGTSPSDFSTVYPWLPLNSSSSYAS
jgi:hypothetical protein